MVDQSASQAEKSSSKTPVLLMLCKCNHVIITTQEVLWFYELEMLSRDVWMESFQAVVSNFIMQTMMAASFHREMYHKNGMSGQGSHQSWTRSLCPNMRTIGPAQDNAQLHQVKGGHSLVFIFEKCIFHMKCVKLRLWNYSLRLNIWR